MGTVVQDRKPIQLEVSPEGTKARIQGDEGERSWSNVQAEPDGTQYFYVHNPNDELGIWSGHAADAVLCVFEGKADGLKPSLFGGSLMPVRFIDDTIGQEYRAKTTEGWKDFTFGYAVYVQNINSFSSGHILDEDGEYSMSILPNVYPTSAEAEAKLPAMKEKHGEDEYTRFDVRQVITSGL